jgi:hypothetical protein
MIIKYLGIGAMAITSLWIGRGYSAYADRRLGEMRGLSALILHMESRLGHTLDYGAELYRGFSDEFLEKCGFLPLLKDGENALSAFLAARPSMVLSESVAEAAERLFSSFGKGYKDQEIARLCQAKKEIDEDIAHTADLLEKNKRVVNALLFGISASCAIILM